MPGQRNGSRSRSRKIKADYENEYEYEYESNKGYIPMKDNKGVYYYPFPDNKRVRMYVKKENGTIFFRLWNADDPNLWEEHGWVPHEAVEEAIKMYEGKQFKPAQAYDLTIAKAVLKENEE